MQVELAQLRRGLRLMPREKKEQIALYVHEIRRRKNDPLVQHREKYNTDPIGWIYDFVQIELARYQLRFFEAIREGYRKIALHGPHGVGKTVLAALLVFWAGSTSYDSKVITTASAWRQLTKFLWPEIHKWHNYINWPKIGFSPELLKLEMTFSSMCMAFAMASDNPATMEGAHAKRIVYIFDESKIIPHATWESAEGAFATEGDHIHVALSTPGEPSGTFYPQLCVKMVDFPIVS